MCFRRSPSLPCAAKGYGDHTSIAHSQFRTTPDVGEEVVDREFLQTLYRQPVSSPNSSRYF
jgi:hypothetical protein